MAAGRRRRHSSSTRIAYLFSSLNEDLLMEILLRLPMKLAFRCKSVSKQWLKLISGNYFASCYAKYHKATGLSPPQFALVNRDHGIIRPRFFKKPPSSDNFVKLTLQEDIIPWNNYILSDKFQFLAASNGFVLCRLSSRSGDVYYVVNPITRQQVTLPPFRSRFLIPEKFCRVGFLANDPFSDSTHPKNSFRIVRIPHADFPSNTIELDIFSSETEQWTHSTISFSSQRSVKRSESYWCPHAVSLNGKLHWLHVWFASEIFVYNPFDDTEKYQRLRLPKDCLGASRYCLGTCHCQAQERKHLKYSEWDEGLIRVWELKDYDRVEWCLLHRVHVSEIRPSVSCISHDVWPPKWLSTSYLPHVVEFHPRDRDLMLCHLSERVLQYNMRTKTLELFVERGQELKVNFCICRSFFIFELPCWPNTVLELGSTVTTS